jgi:hypothetical protein
MWAASWSEMESARASELDAVRGGDLSEKLPTRRKQDVLPVVVLTGVLSPPRLES